MTKRTRKSVKEKSIHETPIKLSPAEMNDPYIVLKKFFRDYDLTYIRIFLREWHAQQLLHGHTEGRLLPDELERLVEAAWLLKQQQKKHQ